MTCKMACNKSFQEILVHDCTEKATTKIWMHTSAIKVLHLLIRLLFYSAEMFIFRKLI